MANDISGAPFDELLKAVSDPRRRAELIDRAAQDGPPPPIRPDFPLVPGTPVSVPGFVTPQPAGGPIAGGPVQPQPKKPETPEEVASNRAAWDEFITNLTDPNGPALALLQFGAQALQPRDPRVSDAAALSGALAQSVGALRNRQAQEVAGQRAERELQTREALAGAQVAQAGAAVETAKARRGVLSAQEGQIRRTTASQDVMDNLRTANAELMRAQAEALRNPKPSGKASVEAIRQQVDLQQAQLMAELFPDRFPSVEHALVAWRKFKVDKGKTPIADAIVSGMQIIPYLKEGSTEFANTIAGLNGLLTQMETPGVNQEVLRGPGGAPEGAAGVPNAPPEVEADLLERAKTDPQAYEDYLVKFMGYPRSRARLVATEVFKARGGVQ